MSLLRPYLTLQYEGFSGSLGYFVPIVVRAFFRAPAGFRSPLLDPVLAGLGLRYVSWTRRGFDTVDGNAAAVLRRLTRRLTAVDVLLLHDGARARTPEG